MPGIGGTGRAISIHAPRAGSDAAAATSLGEGGKISIHAPRAGSDAGYDPDVIQARAISIHAPRAGSDAGCFLPERQVSRFQSTLPVRGATAKMTKTLRHFWQKNINSDIFLQKRDLYSRGASHNTSCFPSKPGANLPGIECSLGLRGRRFSRRVSGFKGSEHRWARRYACSRNAPLFCHTGSPNNKNAGCLFPGP